MEFIKGKWYKSANNNYFKFDKIENNIYYFSEEIYNKKHFFLERSGYRGTVHDLLISNDEIQEYLPKYHPDKIIIYNENYNYLIPFFKKLKIK